MSAGAAGKPSVEQVWAWLAEVPDPEIPVVSVVDLGIVRDVRWEEGGEQLAVAVTPTYTGCPATAVISLMIEGALRERGLDRVRLERRIAPPWTTDWISPAGREKLRAYGVVPPPERAEAFSPLDRALGRGRPEVACPRCGSARTEKVSAFGSTPCKAQHRCRDCLEPFDLFKCI